MGRTNLADRNSAKPGCPFRDAHPRVGKARRFAHCELKHCVIGSVVIQCGIESALEKDASSLMLEDDEARKVAKVSIDER
jgi:argininosuccinate lyase